MASGWTPPCPFTDGVAAVSLFVDDAVPDENAFWGVSGPERMRLFVLDDGAASNVLITIDSAGGASFDDLVAAALPVIETFDLSDRIRLATTGRRVTELGRPGTSAGDRHPGRPARRARRGAA